MLVPAFGIAYEETRASDFIKVDFDGKVILNPHNDLVYPFALIQHLPVMARRPEVNCLIHSHPPAGVAVSMLDCGLLPYNQTAMRFANIPYFTFTGNILGMADIDEFMKCLGDSEAIILRSHGVLTVGKGIPQAFNTMFFLEQACSWQLKAMACNTPLHVPSQEAIDKTVDFFSAERRKKHSIPEMGVREWATVIRMLDRINTDYKL